jgi:hypothetical protein
MLNINPLTPSLSAQVFTKSIDDDKCSDQSAKTLSPMFFFDSATDKSDSEIKCQVNTFGQLATYKSACNKLVPKSVTQPKTDW